MLLLQANRTTETIYLRLRLEPSQYSCLENPMDGGVWQATVHGVTKSRTRLSDFTFTFHFHALEKEMEPTSVFLPGESQGRGSLVGCCLWGHAESDMPEVTQQQQQQQQNPCYLASGPNGVQVLNVSSHKEFSERQSDR